MVQPYPLPPPQSHFPLRRVTTPSHLTGIQMTVTWALLHITSLPHPWYSYPAPSTRKCLCTLRTEEGCVIDRSESHGLGVSSQMLKAESQRLHKARATGLRTDVKEKKKKKKGAPCVSSVYLWGKSLGQPVRVHGSVCPTPGLPVGALFWYPWSHLLGTIP